MRFHLSKGILGAVRSLFTSIRVTLHLSYFVVILLGITLVGTVSFYVSYQSMLERVESASFQIVRQIEKNMDNDFQNKRNLLLAPYYNQEYIDGINAYATMDEQAQFLFRQKIGDLFLKSFNITPIRDFKRFQIYYSSGELLNASDAYKAVAAKDVQNADWFRQTVAKDGRVHFNGPLTSMPAETGEAAYSSSLLIRDFSNPVNFIIVRAEYNDELFRSIGQNDNLSASSRIVILNEHNQQVYGSSERPDTASEPGMLSLINSESGKFWYGSGQDEKLVAYTRSDYSNWKVVLVTPKKEIFGPLDQIKTTTLVTALIAFVVTLCISLLFGRSITNPILDLYKTVNRVKRGDFSVRVHVKRSDEIGRIATNFNDMQDELQTLIESKYIYQIKLQQVELAMLYSQINPHFLYNTLDSIKAMADYYKVEDIGDMAQSLADMFRYNTKSKDEVVTLRDELEQIDAYMNIQRTRFEDKLAYELDIDEELYTFAILKMTLQPLVENAVFYGVEQKLGKSKIRITARKEDNHMLLTISDDGVGMSGERLQEIHARLGEPFYMEHLPVAASEGGIGLRNVYARYAIRLGDQFEFQIDSQAGHGTSVTLKLSAENSLTKPQ
jgi:two-component system sensor histidine kinase YesM